MIRHIFDYIGIPALFILYIFLFTLESKFQLRNRVQKKWKRIIINSIVSIPAFTLLRFLFIPAVVWLAKLNEGLHFGVNYLYHLPKPAEFMIAFLLLDYGNYFWHMLNHKITFLWRFHLVHHTDKDLDVTTAFRFHFGELIGSVFFRGAITLLSGASPFTVLIYEIIFEAATEFHHSNFRLPVKSEKTLNKLIVTPRMHGIHHSTIRHERDANYSVIFSFWDRFHQTLKINIPQDEIVIGIPSYSDPHELTIGFLLKLPFTKIRKQDELPNV